VFPDVSPPVARVISSVGATSGDRDQAVTWLQEPLAKFDGKTALGLIAEGRSDTVLRYLASITSGVVG
jgi:hypothetical protein